MDDAVFLEVAEYLRSNNLRRAVDRLVAYEAGKLAPRGLGIDWRDANVAVGLTETITAIFAARPRIIGSIDEPGLNKLRVHASLIELFGIGKIPGRFTLGSSGVGRMDADAAARMLLFYVQSQADLAKWAKTESIVRRCEISVCSDACEPCATRDGQNYRLDEAPELPCPDCAHKMGCRCIYLAVLEDD